DDPAQAAAFLRPDSRRFAWLRNCYAVGSVNSFAEQNELFRADSVRPFVLRLSSNTKRAGDKCMIILDIILGTHQ
ncbi:hypothetical protein, partial [Paraburkholderia kururiensis]|uniref:hypothetical protein n=1 Tax=Paraburkholderia kururiensis TaxID=984307 RepID=UPI00196AFEDC